MFEKSPCGLVMWNIVGNGKIPDMLPHFMDSPPEGLARSKLAVMNRMEDPIVAEVRARLSAGNAQVSRTSLFNE
jgi:hypothetical protein